MPTETILGGLATELSQQAVIEALNLIYAREATLATAGKQDTAQASLTAIAASVATPSLPSGAATSSRQDTGNTSLASIDGKTPALVSGAVPVSLPSAQVAALTPPAAITGYATETTVAAQLALDTTGIRAQRRDLDTAPVADGQSHVLNTNAIGRLKTSVLPGAIDATTGTITANAQTVSADVSRASNVMIAVTGTFTGVNLSFELSIDGGTTWFATQAVRTNANTIEATTGVIATGVAYAWELSVNACTSVRVRATAFTSGTVNVRILPGSFATEPIPAIQTHPITGAVSAAATFPVQEVQAGNAVAPAQIATTTTTGVLAAANNNRKAVIIYNAAATNLLIAFAATTTATAYTLQILPNGTLVIPRETWTGAISGLLASGTGTAQVTITTV